MIEQEVERDDEDSTAEGRAARLEGPGTAQAYRTGVFAKQLHAQKTMASAVAAEKSLFHRIVKVFTPGTLLKPNSNIVPPKPTASNVSALKQDETANNALRKTRAEEAHKHMIAHQHHVAEASQPTDSAS